MRMVEMETKYIELSPSEKLTLVISFKFPGIHGT